MDKIHNPHVFQYNEDVSVMTLDPAFIKSQSEIWIGAQLYEGLVGLDSNLKPVPALAKRWEISENGNVYKFVIPKNLYFTFCNPEVWGNVKTSKIALKPTDVAYSFYRILDPKTASPGSWIFNDKINMPDFQKFSYSELWKNPKSPIYVENDSTLRIKLKSPFSAFLSLLATNYAWVIPEMTKTWKSGELGRKPVGTGPFFLRKWEENVKLVMIKNPNYRINGLPNLDAVNVSFIKNKQTAFMQFAAGEFDFFNGIEGSFKDEILEKNGQLKSAYHSKLNAIITPFLNTEYIGFNLEDSLNGKLNLLTDKYLRKVLNAAVDRTVLIRYLRNGLGEISNGGFVPSTLLGKSNDLNQIQPSENEIKLWLTKSGYSQKIKSGKYSELTLTVTSDYLDLAVFLQQSWDKIGVHVGIDIQQAGSIRQLRGQSKLSMFRGSWIADYPDAENYLSCFYSPLFCPNGPNYTHYQNKQYDEWYKSIAFDQNISNRQELINTMNQQLSEDLPVLVLYFDKSLRLSQKWVKGLGNDAANRLDLKRVRKEF